jgi:hypothetical protein
LDIAASMTIGVELLRQEKREKCRNMPQMSQNRERVCGV